MVLGLGPTEIVLIVLFIVVIIMGPKKIPELFRALGQSVGELKKGMKDSGEEAEEEVEEEEAAAKPKKKAVKKSASKKEE